MSGKYTEAQKNASIKYLNENTEDIRIRVKREEKKYISSTPKAKA